MNKFRLLEKMETERIPQLSKFKMQKNESTKSPKKY